MTREPLRRVLTQSTPTAFFGGVDVSAVTAVGIATVLRELRALLCQFPAGSVLFCACVVQECPLDSCSSGVGCIWIDRNYRNTVNTSEVSRSAEDYSLYFTVHTDRVTEELVLKP